MHNNKSTVNSKTGSLGDYLNGDDPDLFAKTEAFKDFIDDARKQGYEKYLHSVIDYRGGRALVKHKYAEQASEVILFCSADYLGLAHNSEVMSNAHRAIDAYGGSVSSVPILAGATREHDLLEKNLREFTHVEDIVLFPTGHAANASTISALCHKHDQVISDRSVHESISEGMKLTGARGRVFKHFDMIDLERQLKRSRDRIGNHGILITVEGVGGLDGDIAPLPDIMALAEQYDAKVLLDDAHATGVIGKNGAGSVSYHGMDRQPDIQMGSFSKAFGSVGGWIGTTQTVADYLRYFARSVVYSVGLSPINAAVANGALSAMASDPPMIANLLSNTNYFRNGLIELGLDNAAKSGSAIMSVLVGSESVLREIVMDLFIGGVWAEGLGYPAVRTGEERIRFRIRIAHTQHDLDDALRVIETVFHKHGII